VDGVLSMKMRALTPLLFVAAAAAQAQQSAPLRLSVRAEKESEVRDRRAALGSLGTLGVQKTVVRDQLTLPVETDEVVQQEGPTQPLSFDELLAHSRSDQEDFHQRKLNEDELKALEARTRRLHPDAV